MIIRIYGNDCRQVIRPRIMTFVVFEQRGYVHGSYGNDCLRGKRIRGHGFDCFQIKKMHSCGLPMVMIIVKQREI